MRKHLASWTCEKCEAISSRNPAEIEEHEATCDGSPPLSTPQPEFEYAQELRDWADALEKE